MHVRTPALGWLLLVWACGGNEAHTSDQASSRDAGALGPATTDGAQTDAGGALGPSSHSDAAIAPGVGESDGSAGPVSDVMACNGHPELCARRYDQVAYAGTHNGHSAKEYGYTVVNANQGSGIQKQLEDGVRCLLLDVYDDNGAHVFCHGPCALKSTPHQDGLRTIGAFLETHPREVVTIIYEDHLAVDQIAADFADTKLDRKVYAHSPGEPWPTLGELIDAGTPLVVTLEQGGPPPDWAHHVWDVAFDTPYEFRSAKDFNCDLNRGARENPLFLLNHWVGAGVGSVYLPSESGAKDVNVYDVLYTRAKGCQDEVGRIPNFIAVDFYEHGDLFRVVDALNGF